MELPSGAPLTRQCVAMGYWGEAGSKRSLMIWMNHLFPLSVTRERSWVNTAQNSLLELLSGTPCEEMLVRQDSVFPALSFPWPPFMDAVLPASPACSEEDTVTSTEGVPRTTGWNA